MGRYDEVVNYSEDVLEESHVFAIPDTGRQTSNLLCRPQDSKVGSFGSGSSFSSKKTTDSVDKGGGDLALTSAADPVARCHIPCQSISTAGGNLLVEQDGFQKVHLFSSSAKISISPQHSKQQTSVTHMVNMLVVSVPSSFQAYSEPSQGSIQVNEQKYLLQGLGFVGVCLDETFLSEVVPNLEAWVIWVLASLTATVPLCNFQSVGPSFSSSSSHVCRVLSQKLLGL
jgi:hypothetical protein